MRSTAWGVLGNLVFDAQIAAVCLENGARTILTEDRDFARFRRLTVRPLGG
ncbi:MAG: PIN domain-containing protein [Planctomycetota bacterium]